MARRSAQRTGSRVAVAVGTGGSSAVAAVTRRWPWALGAAVLGAVVGGGVARLVRRVTGDDAPDAQDPDQVEAVVDRPLPADSPGPIPPAV